MPLVPIGAGWLIGIWAALAFALPSHFFLITLVVPLAGLILWRDDPRARLAWIALLVMLVGGLRAASARPALDEHNVATYNDGGLVTLAGVVDDYPDRRDTYVNLRLRAETLRHLSPSLRYGDLREMPPTGPDPDRVPVEGVVLVRADPLGDYRYGDRLEVTGYLQTPPEFATFNYRDYLAGKGIHSVVDQPHIERIARDQGSPIFAALYGLKDRARETIAAILPEPQAALLTGILLGDESGIPQDVKDDFRATGTSHIIAISGYNFAVLIALASVPAVRLFGRRRAFPVLLLLIVAYTVFVGASASVVRAAIMGVLVLWATYLGRQATALNSLIIAAILMTLLDPYTLGDVGFQLSFAATLGLVLYTRPLQTAAERGLARWTGAERAKKTVGVMSDAVLVTLAAQITTLPILVVTFRQISLLTLIVNALVLPAQTGVMVFGGLALLIGMMVLPVGQLVGWLAWLFLAWTIQVIHLFASIPGTTMELGYVDPGWGVAYYIALAAITFYVSRNTEQRAEVRHRMSKIISLRFVLLALVVVGLLVGLALSWRPDGRLHIHALSIDGGPVFVQTPTGRQILIGGSNSPSALLSALGARMPFWDRDLDLIVVSSADAKSLNGLMAVVDRYHIGQIVSVEVGDNRAGREWLDALTAKQIGMLEAGTGIGIEDAVTLTLDKIGWVRIDAGATSIGIGTPGSGSRVDVIVLAELTDKAAAWLKSNLPSIVVTRSPVGPDRLVEGIAFVSAEARSIELIFDGAQWSVHEAP